MQEWKKLIKTQHPKKKKTQITRLKNSAEDLNRCFSKGGMQMAKRHMKRCSASLIIKETQIKITMRYHPTLVRMVIIKKHTNNKCQPECGYRRTLLECRSESKLMQLLWKPVLDISQRNGNRTTVDSAISLLGMELKETKTLTKKF